MTRQKWYPIRVTDQFLWLGNFSIKVKAHAVALGLNPAEAEEIVLDALWLVYLVGSWQPAARILSKTGTLYLESAQTGIGDLALPVFDPPPLPEATETMPATVPRPFGCLNRIFAFVQRIKSVKPGYNTVIGKELGIEVPESATERPSPKFALKLGQRAGSACQCVVVSTRKYGHQGVWAESRRGDGAWEHVGVTTARVFVDERPLLVAGQPEVREYRLRYWDKGVPNGPWSPVSKVTVAP